jgi:hypothetical protein
MALTATTIAAAIDGMTNIIRVTAATGCVVGQPARIDNEYVKIQGISDTNLTVFRGMRGTKAVAHNALADFVTGPWADFPVEMFPLAGSYTYSVDGAITIATGVHKLIKGTALAATLAIPTTAQEGLELTIVSLNAVAHVITVATPATTDEAETLTFGGAIGDSVTLIAVNGQWAVKYLRNVTVADVA